MQNLKVNRERLWQTVDESARFGATAGGGITRLALSEEDRLVREWFARQCRDLGCEIIVDDMGNMFARRQGHNNTLPPVTIGSHLDTQPSGGRFDGIAGVLAGLEILRTLHDAQYNTNAPVEVINWTNEEGSRFPPPMIASGVFGRFFSKDYAYSRLDANGISLVAELERIGYRGQVGCGDRKLGAYFELHIEQGPLLEKNAKTIGILSGAQGMRWYAVSVVGQDSHAGSTPMNLRKDAMLACARITEAVNRIALENPPGVGTVGRVQVKPNSPNVVPGSVVFSIDLRHPEPVILQNMEDRLKDQINDLRKTMQVEISIDTTWDSPPVKFDNNCIKVLREAVEFYGYTYLDMVSGTGHDAVYVSRVAPTAMIFIPCRDGIGHAEIEYASPEHLEAGANTLLQAVLRYDRLLA